MNNLHRDLAPVSAAAWAEIEDEVRRTFKEHLAGRRVVDVDGPTGPDRAAVTRATSPRSPRPATDCAPGCTPRCR